MHTYIYYAALRTVPKINEGCIHYYSIVRQCTAEGNSWRQRMLAGKFPRRYYVDFGRKDGQQAEQQITRDYIN